MVFNTSNTNTNTNTTTTMSFDPTKPCRTRDGRAVEILTTKAAGHFPIVGNVNGVSEFESWTKNGDAFHYSGPNLLDLVNYEPEPWALPDPPHGYEWLRADGWTKEMLPDGWRPYLKGEEKVNGDEYYNMFREFRGETGDGSYFFPAFWYITKRPLPAPKPKTVKVPLEASDIPPGSIIAYRNRIAETWFTVQGVKHKGVLIATTDRVVYFDDLMRNWEIKRPGEEWKSCYKEVEA